MGTAGENHLDVGAGIGRRGRGDWRADKSPHHHCRGANDTNKSACTHAQMLTYRPRWPYRRLALPGRGLAKTAPITMSTCRREGTACSLSLSVGNPATP